MALHSETTWHFNDSTERLLTVGHRVLHLLCCCGLPSTVTVGQLILHL